MLCGYCGAELVEGVNFCYKCGKPVGKEVVGAARPAEARSEARPEAEYSAPPAAPVAEEREPQLESQGPEREGKRRGRVSLLAFGLLAVMCLICAGSATGAYFLLGLNERDKVEWIVYTSDGSNEDGDTTMETDIWAMKVDGTESRQLTFDEVSDLSPDLSPDETKVVFESDGRSKPGLYAVSIDGTELSRLTTESSDSSPVWSPDGEQIAFLSERDGPVEIYVMDADGSNVERLTENEIKEGDIAWSPDGQQMAFTTFKRGSRYDIHVLTIERERVKSVTDDENFNVSPAWSADGQYLVYTSWSLEEIDSDRPFIILTTVLGKEVYVLFQDGDLGTERLTASVKRVAVDGSDVEELTDGEHSDWSPSCSADGRHIVFSSRRGGDAEIYIMNADGSEVTALTDNKKGDYSPSW